MSKEKESKKKIYEDALKLAYKIGFNHAKHCEPYQGDDIVKVLSKAKERGEKIKWT